MSPSAVVFSTTNSHNHWHSIVFCLFPFDVFVCDWCKYLGTFFICGYADCPTAIVVIWQFLRAKSVTRFIIWIGVRRANSAIEFSCLHGFVDSSTSKISLFIGGLFYPTQKLKNDNSASRPCGRRLVLQKKNSNTQSVNSPVKLFLWLTSDERSDTNDKNWLNFLPH